MRVAVMGRVSRRGVAFNELQDDGIRRGVVDPLGAQDGVKEGLAVVAECFPVFLAPLLVD